MTSDDLTKQLKELTLAWKTAGKTDAEMLSILREVSNEKTTEELLDNLEKEDPNAPEDSPRGVCQTELGMVKVGETVFCVDRRLLAGSVIRNGYVFNFPERDPVLFSKILEILQGNMSVVDVLRSYSGELLGKLRKELLFYDVGHSLLQPLMIRTDVDLSPYAQKFAVSTTWRNSLAKEADGKRFAFGRSFLRSRIIPKTIIIEWPDFTPDFQCFLYVPGDDSADTDVFANWTRVALTPIPRGPDARHQEFRVGEILSCRSTIVVICNQTGVVLDNCKHSIFGRACLRL